MMSFSRKNIHASLMLLALVELISLMVPSLKYFGYVVPFLCIFYFCVVSRKIYVPTVVYPFLVLMMTGILLVPLVNFDGLKDLLFIFSGIVVAMAFPPSRIRVGIVVLFMIAGWFINVALGGGEASSFDVLNSESPFESVFSFILGFGAIACLIERKWAYFFLALMATFFSAKRIAILGVLVVFAIFFLPKRLRALCLNRYVLIAFNFLYVFIVIAYVNGLFDDYIVMLTGLSADALGMGRQHLYADAVENISDSPFRFLFFGDGPGSAYQTASVVLLNAGKINLHNDILKIFYEYGGVALFFFLFFLHSQKRDELKLYAIYFNVVLLTDNCLIYHFFLFAYCLFVLNEMARGVRVPATEPDPAKGLVST